MRKELSVLMFALHPDPHGFMGGGFVRTYEVLKRGRKYNVNYYVIEPRKSFKDVDPEMEYQVFKLPYSLEFYKTLSNLRLVIDALKIGLQVVRKYDIDLLYSPVEVNPSSILPALMYFISKVPWTIMLQFIPVYGVLTAVDKLSKKPISLAGLYGHLRVERKFPMLPSINASLYYLALFKVLTKAPLHLTISRIILNDFKKLLPSIAKRLYVVWPANGIDYDKFKKLPDVPKDFDAVFVSSYHPKKGIWDVLDIWRIVIKKYPSAKLAIMGRLAGSPDLARKMLKILTKKIKHYNLSQNVILVGDLINGFSSQRELWINMKRGKILLYPSKIDAWGLLIGEALACGLPVITWDILPFRDAYGRSSSVIFIPLNDKFSFAMKIVELLSNSEKLEILSRDAINYIRNYHYTWDQVTVSEREGYIKVLESWGKI